MVLALALFAILTLLSLPPAEEWHHAFVKHGWEAVRAYAVVKNADPGDLDPKKLDGEYECLDGAILKVVWDGEFWDIAVQGIEAGREFLYTCYPSKNYNTVYNKISRCVGE